MTTLLNAPWFQMSALYKSFTYLLTYLLNRAIFNDLEQPQTQISRSGHSLTLNISEMAKDTAIVTMEGE